MPEIENTADDFLAEKFTILMLCDVCEHPVPLDRSGVPPGVTVQELHGRPRCSRSDSLEMSIRIVYKGAGRFQHGG